MNIKNIEECKYELITTEEGKEYRRYFGGNWEKLWGMSWECLYDCVDIEKAYQRKKAIERLTKIKKGGDKV